MQTTNGQKQSRTALGSPGLGGTRRWRLTHVSISSTKSGLAGIRSGTARIRDLLGVEIDGQVLLPADEAGQKDFDNVASALPISQALLEDYLLANRKVSRRAVGKRRSIRVSRSSLILRRSSRTSGV